MESETEKQEEINAPKQFNVSGSGDGEVKLVRFSKPRRFRKEPVFPTKLVEHGSAGRFWLCDGRPHVKGQRVDSETGKVIGPTVCVLNVIEEFVEDNSCAFDNGTFHQSGGKLGYMKKRIVPEEVTPIPVLSAKR